MTAARKPIPGDVFALDVPDAVPAVWGRGDDVLWAQGEPVLIVGPQGVGKSAVAQQLVLARAGVRKPAGLLSYPVAADDRRVLYLAMDRPAQIQRSLRRMVTEDDRATLRDQLVAWRGPLPFRLADDPSRLAAWAAELGAGTIVVDSLKDLGVPLTEEDGGHVINRAAQHAVAAGIEYLGLHHQRKAQQGDRKPRSLDDVYGSTWITSGTGSVILLWGEPGDPLIELSHLKQPVAEVGPLTLHHDHDRGRTTLPDAVDLLDLAARPEGITAPEAAAAVYGVSSPDRNQRERVRRRLDKLVDKGRLTAERKPPPDTTRYLLPTQASVHAVHGRVHDPRAIHADARNGSSTDARAIHADARSAGNPATTPKGVAGHPGVHDPANRQEATT